MDWDPEDRNAVPRWRARAVLNLLMGLDFERDDLRCVRGQKTEALYFVDTIRFQCGCVAADDSGWRSCGRGLHGFLSECEPNGPEVREFRLRREIFDAVLAKAWKRRGGKPENYYEFYEAQMRTPFLQFEKWQQTHNLMGRSVWKNGYLQAELQDVTMEQEIVLAPVGSSRSATLEISCQDYRGCFALVADVAQAIRAVFGD